MQHLPIAAAWLACALTLVATTAQAQPTNDKPRKRKSVTRCVDYQQTLSEGQDAIDLELTSTCKFDVECTMSWKLVCDSDDEKSPQRVGERAFGLASGTHFTAEASGSACGDDGWEVVDVRWTCNYAGDTE